MQDVLFRRYSPPGQKIVMNVRVVQESVRQRVSQATSYETWNYISRYYGPK